jgi:CarD family transcriptional regulator
MTIMIPVEKSDDLGIRAIVSKEEALKAIEMIGQEFEPITSDWKLRYQMNLDLLKKGSINDIASIVRCLYHRSKVKELPILERKLYDSAKKLLEDEIAYSLEKTNKEVEAMIHAKLEPLGLMHAKTQSSFAKDFGDEDDEEFNDLDENEDEENEDDDDDDMMDDDDE